MNFLYFLKSSILLTFFLTLAVAFTQCQPPTAVYSGVLQKQPLSMGAFSELAISGDHEVFLRRGANQEVVVVAPSDLDVSRLIKVKNNQLIIKPALGDLQQPIEIYITLPTLTQLATSGKAVVRTATSFSGAEMVISASGNAKVRYEGEHALLQVATSGRAAVKLTGKSRFSTIAASGNSQIAAASLETKATDISASGFAKVMLYATEEINAEASGISRIEYVGNPPRKNFSQTGSAVIIKQNSKSL